VDIADYVPAQSDIEFVIGGPPCQTFSAAGRRASGVPGTSDARGRLFHEYVRLVRDLQPRGFLFENVYGLTGAQGGDALNEIRREFQAVGYKLSFRVLDSADYGVPQHRERLFIVGLRDGGFDFPRPSHGPDSADSREFYPAGEAVTGCDVLDAPRDLGGRYGHLLAEIPPGLNYSFFTAKLGHPQPIFAWRSKFSDFLYKADPSSPVRTLKAQGGQYTGPFSWENRPFSLAELKRLQTIPDAYVIVGGRQTAIQQIGNSVPPQMARMLALAVRDRVFNSGLPSEIEYLLPSQPLGFRTRKRLLTAVYADRAREAISKLQQPSDRQKLGGQTWRESRQRSLHDDFGWREADSQPDTQRLFRVRDECDGETWKIVVGRLSERRRKPAFTIEIVPAQGAWSLPCAQVRLDGIRLDCMNFLAAWKALEEVLPRVAGAADLVQLNGYYQYPPALTATISYCDEPPLGSFWWIVQKVVSGGGVGSTLNLGGFLGVWCWWTGDPAAAEQHLRKLRDLGFEVRSNNTNRQIPQGRFLVPYAFPTLGPQSVQRLKKM
jgi:DNA (cytosine-5)-methyltransferase 1